MSEETVLQRDLVIHGGGILVREDKDLSEKEVLELVKKGDREAYQEIVIRYMKRAYYIALGFVQNPQDAMDLSQESFIRAFRKIKSFNDYVFYVFKKIFGTPSDNPRTVNRDEHSHRDRFLSRR